MKKILITLFIPFALFVDSAAQNAVRYKVITVVESIVPGGVGRSRMIESQSDMDIDELTTGRTEGKDTKQSGVNRKSAKAKKFQESKLLNFYSVTGINFQNIASNDALITDKLNKLAEVGWELLFVTSGVESDAGETDGKGIYVTRFILKRNE